MYLNTIQATNGSRKSAKRVGRGIGSTFGKTCGRGHKGQKSRSGGFHKIGFEGGLMPLQRRLPKLGFSSRVKKYSAEVTLHEIGSLNLELVNVEALRLANLVPSFAKHVKLIQSGEITIPVTIQGLKVTSGAKASIEAAGGKIEV
ncbi:MAG: 50S ribosomal protein L15 [Methylococcaceae bacterium]|nr:50S ribosomal protein L15 [Methylococcaceae bacterium]